MAKLEKTGNMARSSQVVWKKQLPIRRELLYSGWCINLGW